VNGVLTAMAAGLGAIVGSFLNVLVHRMPRDEPFGLGRSRCPRCGATIGWYDNVPILSYLLLRGRCRACSGRISLRYPLVEAVTALLFAIAWSRARALAWEPAALGFLAAAGFAAVVVAASFIDLEHKILPDRLTLRAGPVFGVVASIGVPRLHGTALFGVELGGAMKPGLASLLAGVAGAAVGGGVVLLLRQVGTWIARREAMGLGDVKFMAMCGLMLGPGQVLLAMWAAVLVAALAGVAIWAVTRNREIPFGPYLGLGSLAALFYGAEMERLLLRELPALLRGG
jgi:leader peptidase (prepilin peptidase)/N-methyltransferase